MPTLRHTKSEEHLDINNLPANAPTTISEVSAMHLTSTGALKDLTSIDGATVPDCSDPNSMIKDKAITRIEKVSECSNSTNDISRVDLNELTRNEDDVWSQEDDEITAQYLNMHKACDRDAISQMSLDSCDSREQSNKIIVH